MSLRPSSYEAAKIITARYEAKRREKVENRPKLTFAEALEKRLSKPQKPRTAPLRAKRKALRAKPDRKLAEWSRKVRERDDYTCRVTGIRDVRRNVAHHVAPRSRRPDLRLNVDNGITVTPETHQWIHDHPIEAMRAGWLSDKTYEAARKEAA